MTELTDEEKLRFFVYERKQVQLEEVSTLIGISKKRDFETLIERLFLFVFIWLLLSSSY